MSVGKGQSWNEKGGKGGKDGGKNPWQRGSGKKGSKGQEKGGKGDSREMLDVWQDRTHCSVVKERREATKMCTPSVKTTVKTSKNQLTTKKICKHVVCWKKVNMSSGKR